ncbi:cytochrome P450 [Athelia psychrophila]|uniref:Cytochrome P450 n=1 Tax=Athelia psychrophila TaxID=1759441 RepID=A0A166TDA8_9AGAM|nr:cytochrome P450 [Fibularhizoctonia sp. CBS 109695]
MLTADDEYKGYVIPKGTIIIANAHQILHDETVYPDPYTFKPERFLKDGKIDQSVMNPTIAAFGFGRRVCPGRGLAEKSAWLTCGSILAAFHLSKATDAKGATIEPSARYLSGLTRHPEPFQCQIKPRSDEIRDIIKATERR